MKACQVDTSQKIVSAVELADGINGIRRLIGYGSVDSEETDTSGDRLFFDEGCFLRDQTGKGRFKLDSLVPVADKAVIVGSSDKGATLRDVVARLAALQQRIVWL